MKMQGKKARVKGFTLVEMITVVAIITILLGILTPAMMSYLRKSRISSANANAKLVYNAAQTEIQKYIARERVMTTSDRVFDSKKWWIAYETAGQVVKAQSHDGGSIPTSIAAIDSSSSLTANEKQFCTDVVNNVNSVVSGASEVCWAVYVDNYIVKGCVSADSLNSRYIGYYTSSSVNTGKDGRRQDEMASQTYQNGYLSVLGGRINTYNGVANP